MGPPTMIVVWNPKSRSIFAHRFVNELLNFEKFLTNKGLSITDSGGLWGNSRVKPFHDLQPFFVGLEGR